jgi:hypothetical protein
LRSAAREALAAEKLNMRKLTILLALAALTASNAGCCCGVCGRVRNWFHKGSPCGTAMAPAVLGAPLAMGTPLATPVVSAPAPYMTAPAPMMSAPAMCVEQAPMCVPCQPCEPCCDPCSGAATTGYGGDYISSGLEGCGCGGVPMTEGPATTMQGTTQIVPGPTE